MVRRVLDLLAMAVATAVLLNGDDLTIDDVWSVAVEGVAAALSAAGDPIVASFENEPRNLNALKAALPANAISVFLDTRHSPAPDSPAPDAEWIGDFAGH